MVQLFIIADDFTGALDTGVQLSSKGIRTKVITRGEDELTDLSAASFQDLENEILVLVYDSESRHLTAEEAGEIVGKAAKLAVKAGIRYLYKKTDSALRGNIGAELSAVLRSSQEEKLAFIPAFPKMNRGTRDGVHYIGNVPVGESVFAADPFNPVKHSKVSEIIQEQSPVSVQRIKTGQDDWKDAQGILVFDAVTQEDLAKIAEDLKRDGRVHTMAGCAGFAGELPQLLGLQEKEVQMPELDQKLTVLCGSINPITQSQIRKAEGTFARVCIIPEEKLGKDYFSDENAPALEHFLEVLRSHLYVVIDSNDADDVMAEEGKRLAKELGLSVEDVRSRISASLGQLMKGLYESMDLGLVLITGGDTLFQCMKQLQVTEMEPIGELFPGVVLASYIYKKEKRYVITKSGGFGEETLLLDIVKRLKEEA